MRLTTTLSKLSPSKIGFVQRTDRGFKTRTTTMMMSSVQMRREITVPNSYECNRSHYNSSSSTCHYSTSGSDKKHGNPQTIDELLSRLRTISTSSLCDAEKSFRDGEDSSSKFLRGVLPSNILPLRSSYTTSNPIHMVGIARTIECDVEDGVGDFLAVVHALRRVRPGDVLVISASQSKVAVCGGLFTLEAARKGLSGIVLDGPCRDIQDIQSIPSFPFYSTSINPFSGTMKQIGAHQIPVTICNSNTFFDERKSNSSSTSPMDGSNGVMIYPGDIIVGDADGVVVIAIGKHLTDLNDKTRTVDGEESLKQDQQQEVLAKKLVDRAEEIESKEREWMNKMMNNDASLLDLLQHKK